jgi:ABC-type multidrug transport system ATPase subunit
LVKPADLYLFDEPTQSLDPERADAIVALIKKHLKEEGKTALYVAHRINEALMIADDIIVIDEGKLIGQFSTKEFMASAKPAVISLRKDIEFSWRAEE